MIRLGRISYVNMAPVFFELEAEVEEVSGVPTELNERLIAGEIDLAPISSIAYGRHADVLHPVSKEGAENTDFGTREFATIDLDGNLVTYFQWRDS